MSADRQLDIPATQGRWFTIPRYVPGRLTALDFIHFKWCGEINPADYLVIIESLDTAGPRFRSIGQLSETLELPHVQYPWDCTVGVIPTNDRLPSFSGKLGRGATYFVPKTGGNKGEYKLEKYGSSRPSGL